jgi:uncharacterized protein
MLSQPRSGLSDTVLLAMSRVPLLAALLAVATMAGLVGPPAAAASPLPSGGISAAQAGSFTAHGSVEQVAVTGTAAGTHLRLVDRGGTVLASGRTDRQGAFLFRHVIAGDGDRVEAGTVRSAPLHVLRPTETPPASFYTHQQLGSGYGYLTTRDGTTLAVNVHLPGPPELGPYPTVVEYSGYDPANPDNEQPASRIAQLLGYATVGVNMRGTGCSGGAWNYFEPLQALDGYDAIETVAAQPWVLHHAVGMVGISYPGITQLFVAATQPPHLAAITPLSVIDDTYRGILYPGGILNTGFAVAWAEDRQHDARPAGQEWARRRIAEGDAVCAANQSLRLQTPNVLAVIRGDRFNSPALAYLSPDKLAAKITAPTFLAGAVTDERTGGHWPELISHIPAATKLKATITNGTHVEPFGPSVITRWAEFLDFYVAGRIPSVPALARAVAAQLYVPLAGGPLPLPPDRFTGQTSFAAALTQYEAEPRVRVLFDNGAGGPTGAPVPAFEDSFPTWPPPAVTPTTWYLRAGGRLDRAAPAKSDHGSDHYRYDPSSVSATDAAPESSDLFAPLPPYNWKPPKVGTALTYTTDPLTSDVVLTGPASANLWLRASAPDTDLEVAVTEVRPDGQETYVQSGWLRTSHRTTLDPATSTALEPRYTDQAAQTRTMPTGQYTQVRVPLFPIAHAFRAGSRIRVIIQAPGGNQPLWAFEDLPAHGSARNDVSRSGTRASTIVLPVNPTVSVPTPLPACPGLRGEPCRPASRAEIP